MKQLTLKDQVPTGVPRVVVTDSKRVPLERKVILKFHHFGGFFIEYSANVSLTGMFIKTDSAKPPGSVFIFEIWLGDEHKLVHGVGEVVWVRREDENSSRPAGMGVRFIKIDDDSRAVVQRVIDEQLAKGGPVFDLAEEGPETEERSGLSLVEPTPAPKVDSDLLLLDEDLLGFDRPAAASQTAETGAPARVVEGAGRGLRVALFLVFLGAVMGGAAYLFSADILPF